MKNKVKEKRVTISERDLMVLDRFMDMIDVVMDNLSHVNQLHTELEDQWIEARAIVQEKYRDVRG